MSRRRTQPTPDLPTLLESWTVHLTAENKSRQTINSYRAGVTRFLTWCAGEGREPVLDRASVNAFTVALLEGGATAGTAKTRQETVRLFSKWLYTEGEIEADQLMTLRPPKLPQKLTPKLSDDEIRRLISVCSGRDFRDRRDEAIVRLMFESGLRAGEVVGMRTTDVDLARGLAGVHGKGDKARLVPFGPHTGRSLDRYLRLRRLHRLAFDSSALWLGANGRKLGYPGLWQTLRWRAGLAHIENFHPHVLRHTAAQRWLAAGGSEGGLMAIAGWTRRDMIDHYTASTKAERAADEARRLNLGDF